MNERESERQTERDRRVGNEVAGREIQKKKRQTEKYNKSFQHIIYLVSLFLIHLFIKYVLIYLLAF